MLNRKIPVFIAAALALCWLLSLSVRASSAGSEEAAPVYLPIVMYHEVKNAKAGKDAIQPWEFESDLKYLAENGYTTITMRDLIEHVYNGAPLPEKPVILTFDDGYLNTYIYAFPLLKQYNMKIVLSIIGKNTDDFSKIPDDNLDYSHVTWDQLNEMLNSGLVEVQNHTYNLHKCWGRFGCKQMPNESDAEYERILTEDIGGLQDEIKEMTGKTPDTFAYPYGKKDGNTDRILKEMGFRATLSCDYGINVIGRDPEVLFSLKRICREHSQGIGKMIAQAMETVRK